MNGIECVPEDIPGHRFEFDDEVPGFGRVREYHIVANDRRGLQAGFAIRVRKRIVVDSSLFGLSQQTHGFFNIARISGELHPDFIDPVGQKSRREQFVIDTARSGLNPEDPAVEALQSYAREKLQRIAQGLASARSAERRKAALKRNPKFEERLRSLGPEVYEKLNLALESLI